MAHDQNVQPSTQMSVLSYRVDELAKNVAQLRENLHLYVPISENKLQLQSIQDTVARIERDVINVKNQIESIDDKIIEQDRASRERDIQEREKRNETNAKVM